MLIDFSNCKKAKTYYGGSERKFGIIYKGDEYILKFRKETLFGEKRFNHVSEYLGSHIFSILGFEVQETILGTYNGEEVVACKNFLSKDELFVPFNDVGESSLEQDKDSYQYSYDDITQMLQDNIKLTNVKETIEMFWNIYVVDALIGNFDRHGGNWGFIKSNNKYSLAPIFDNGSCLFPQMVDEGMMHQIMCSTKLTNERIYKFPTSQILLNGKKSSYFDVISSLSYKECNNAVLRVVRNTDFEEIEKLINEVDFLTDMHKRFYIYMLRERFEKILVPSFNVLKGREL